MSYRDALILYLIFAVLDKWALDALLGLRVHQQAVLQEPEQDLQAVLIIRVLAAYLLHLVQHPLLELPHSLEILRAQLTMGIRKLGSHGHELLMQVTANVYAIEYHPHISGVHEYLIASP